MANNAYLSRTFEEFARLRKGEFENPIGRNIARQGFMVGAHALIGIIQRTPEHLFVQVMKDIQQEAEAELKLMNPGANNGMPKIKTTINEEPI